MAALDYFERLGHDNHRRLCRVYGWEEKKTKASWGGSTVDYKTIAEKAVREMNMQDVQHFLVVVLARLRPLLPGFQSSAVAGQRLESRSHRRRYKIDTAKLAADVRDGTVEKSEQRRPEEQGESRSKSATNESGLGCAVSGPRSVPVARLHFSSNCYAVTGTTTAASGHFLRHRP